METRRLGRTGHESTLVILGTAAFWEIDQEGANAALNLAMERGINHIDIAPGYQMAEERVGPWLEPYRDRFFISCKTQERRRDPAMFELNRSLKRLRTDHFEVYQLHAVNTLEELDKAFASGGAMETLKAARDQGKVQYLGITGHGLEAPTVQLAALERFDFDTIMFPIHPRLYADEAYRHAAERLLEVAASRDVGVMIIKSITKGPWGDHDKIYNTWYRPYDTYEEIEPGVRFALSQPVTGIASAAEVHLLPMVIQAAEQFTPMSADEQAALIERHTTNEPLFVPGMT